MKTLKLFMLSLLFASAVYAGEETELDSITTPLRNGIKWGMSQEQVQQLSPCELKTIKDRLMFCNYFELYVYKVTQEDSSKWFTAITENYRFTGSKLTSKDIEIILPGNFLAAHAKYLELKSSFTEEYGAPVESADSNKAEGNIEIAEWKPEELDSTIKLAFLMGLRRTMIYFKPKE